MEISLNVCLTSRPCSRARRKHRCGHRYRAGGHSCKRRDKRAKTVTHRVTGPNYRMSRGCWTCRRRRVSDLETFAMADERPSTPEGRCHSYICSSCGTRIRLPTSDDSEEPSTPTQASFNPAESEPPTTPPNKPTTPSDEPTVLTTVSAAYTPVGRKIGTGSVTSTVQSNVKEAAGVQVATCVVSGKSDGSDAIQNCHVIAKATPSPIVSNCNLLCYLHISHRCRSAR